MSSPRTDLGRHPRERGAVSIVALFLVLAVGGLSFGLLQEGLAARQTDARLNSNLRSLEAGESGVAWAEEELACFKDPAGDGVGNLTGSLGGGTFDVRAVKDTTVSDRWTFFATGGHGLSKRRIEVGVRRLPSPWEYGIFGKDAVTISGGMTTDAYDSRLGTYASQAVNSDAGGSYAVAMGKIGSNGSISVASSRIRGDAEAGVGKVTTVTGTGVVTGETDSRTAPAVLPTPTLAEFQAANTTNNNGTWTSTGGLVYSAATKLLSVSAGHTLTLTGSTYFFSSITFSGNAILRVTGPVKIYVTGNVNLSGGAVVNATGQPSNLQIVCWPYALPLGFVPPVTPTVAIAGGAQNALTVYAPAHAIALSGNAPVWGALIGKTFTASGGAKAHYDLALIDELGTGWAKVARLYWREPTPPRR
jgi:hypothetical protein